jgi:hypothetical protein
VTPALALARRLLRQRNDLRVQVARLTRELTELRGREWRAGMAVAPTVVLTRVQLSSMSGPQVLAALDGREIEVEDEDIEVVWPPPVPQDEEAA